jgi:hypothetical protein
MGAMGTPSVYVGVFLISLAIQLVALAIRGEPLPTTHDEFSNLFGAETFVNFRLANPALAHPEYFDTFHILTRPTYSSMFPPGVAFSLAVGKLLFNSFIAGSLLSTSFAALAFSWMIRRVCSDRIALLAGVLINIAPVILDWTFSYWSGSVAFAGGALMFGVFLGIYLNEFKKYYVVLFFLGVFLVSIVRPFEGLVYTGLTAVLCIGYAIKNNIRIASTELVTALILSLAILASHAYYNKQVTGEYLVVPHVLYSGNYLRPPLFIWSTENMNAPTDRPHRKALAQEELQLFTPQHRWSDLWLTAEVFRLKYEQLFRLYYNPILLFLLLFGLVNGGRERVIWISCAYLAVYLLLCTHHFRLISHYASPFVPVYFFAVVFGAREIWRVDASTNRRIAKLLVVVAVVISLPFYAAFATRGVRGTWSGVRKAVIEQLEKQPFASLVFVEYGRNHSVHQEWVYNSPNIDRQKVILARSLGRDKDRELVASYRNRRVFKLVVNEPEIRIEEY